MLQRLFQCHTLRARFVLAILVGFASLFCGATSSAQAQSPVTSALSAEQRQGLVNDLQELEKSLKSLRERSQLNLVDAEVFAKGLKWALDYDREFNAADVALMQKAVTRCRERFVAYQTSQTAWRSRRGKVALAYRSNIDDSVQPYGLIVPKGYDSNFPIRLDVVLHGSTRPVGLSELRFLSRFDEGDAENPSPPDQPYIELHPLGRVENCYRWAGETDVFEAIEDVCHRYNIDRDRIVLRGMSMGASGTWHLGLKHPDRFVALGPYCGYVDTHRFSETPLANFVKVGPLPEHQELGLHMLDSVDYAANAGVVPAIACMGEKDVFFDAHVIMGDAFKREGLTMVNLISPGTGHVIDPVTHGEQMRQIGEYVQKGLNHKPADIRFVTWTLKYSRCHWLQVLGLERHYSRAEFSGHFKDQILEIAEPTNITRFVIHTAQLPSVPRQIRIGQTTFEIPASPSSKPPTILVERSDNRWRIADTSFDDKTSLTGKRPGLQGPIDDAFTTPFLCVRGTGTPWSASTQAYSDASLNRFSDEWRHYFRGDLPIKNDTDVTAEDLRTRNLILFGDPGSNAWIAKTLPQLPLTWTKDSFTLAGKEYATVNHLPALIAPNPLPGASGRYVVINSGHTFREAELAKLNYLLFPRWGDWAVLEIDPNRKSDAPVAENVLRAGYFDEQWQAR